MMKNPVHRGFAYLFIFFTAFYFFLNSGHFYATDEAQLFETARSLVTRGELSIPLELVPEKGVGDKYYSPRGIAPSVAAIPYYLAGHVLEKALPARFVEMIARARHGDIRDFFTGDIKIFAVNQLNIHLSALLCAVFYLFLMRFGLSLQASLLAALLLGVSTIIGTYSKFFHSQTLGCLTLVTSVYFLFSPKTRKSLFLSGVFLGVSILTRLEHVLALPLFLYYFLTDEHGTRAIPVKKTGTALVVFLVPVLLGVLANGFVDFLKFGVFLVRARWLERINILIGLYGNLFSVGKSIFIFSPPLLLSLCCLGRVFRSNFKKTVFIYALSALFVISYSGYSIWHATWSWGSRYLYVIVPFLLVPAGFFIEEMLTEKKPWQMIVFASFLLTGFFVQVLGMTPYMFDLAFNYDWQKIIPDVTNFYYFYIFIPDISPLAVHWDVVSAGRYIDYWFYHVFVNYGFRWALLFGAVPALALIYSLRGMARLLRSAGEIPGQPRA